MIYRTVNILVYIISVLLAMYGLQAFDFERFLKGQNQPVLCLLCSRECGARILICTIYT